MTTASITAPMQSSNGTVKPQHQTAVLRFLRAIRRPSVRETAIVIATQIASRTATTPIGRMLSLSVVSAMGGKQIRAVPTLLACSSSFVFVLLALGAAGPARQPDVRVTGDGVTCTLTVNAQEVSSKTQLRSTIGSAKSIVLKTDDRTPKGCIIEAIALRLSPEFNITRIMVNGRPGHADIVPLERPEGKFALLREGGGLGLYIDESVSFSIIRGGPSDRWEISRNTTETNWCGRKEAGRCVETRTPSYAFIDERTCPALKPVIARLAQVRAVERGAAHGIVTDTPLTSLITYGPRGMQAERLSEYEGPLVDWWQSASGELKECWTTQRPPRK